MATHVLVDTDSVQTVANKDLTGATLTAPILSGTATGVYTLGGTPTISSPSLTTPTVTGALTIAGQIVFPATQNASAGANTLDDYEEGTWTPSLGGNTTYSTQTGTYTKIGRMVYVSLVLTVTTLGTGSTSVISGLPFTCEATNSWALSAGFSTSLAVSPVSLNPYVVTGTTTIQIVGRTAGAAATSTQAIFGNSASILISGSYMV